MRLIFCAVIWAALAVGSTYSRIAFKQELSLDGASLEKPVFGSSLDLGIGVGKRLLKHLPKVQLQVAEENGVSLDGPLVKRPSPLLDGDLQVDLPKVKLAVEGPLVKRPSLDGDLQVDLPKVKLAVEDRLSLDGASLEKPSRGGGLELGIEVGKRLLKALPKVELQVATENGLSLAGPLVKRPSLDGDLQVGLPKVKLAVEDRLSLDGASIEKPLLERNLNLNHVGVGRRFINRLPKVNLAAEGDLSQDGASIEKPLLERNLNLNHIGVGRRFINRLPKVNLAAEGDLSQDGASIEKPLLERNLNLNHIGVGRRFINRLPKVNLAAEGDLSQDGATIEKPLLGSNLKLRHIGIGKRLFKALPKLKQQNPAEELECADEEEISVPRLLPNPLQNIQSLYLPQIPFPNPIPVPYSGLTPPSDEADDLECDDEDEVAVNGIGQPLPSLQSYQIPLTAFQNLPVPYLPQIPLPYAFPGPYQPPAPIDDDLECDEEDSADEDQPSINGIVPRPQVALPLRQLLGSYQGPSRSIPKPQLQGLYNYQIPIQMISSPIASGLPLGYPLAANPVVSPCEAASSEKDEEITPQ